MAERSSFDTMLSKALMEAVWEEYCQSPENEELPPFSPRYLRWRTKLLSSPFTVAKKQLRPLWVRGLRAVACFLLVCALALGSLMAASPVVRATVLNWLREISGDDIFYYQWEKTGQAVSPSYRPTWLPENFVITDVQSKGAHDWWNFESQDDSATGLTCACFGPASNGIGTSLQDAQDIRKTVTIQGRTADYYDTGTTRLLVWEDAEGNLLYVSSSGDVEEAELMKVAQSMTPYRDASASYRLETVPEGYEPFWRYETCGAMQEEWIKDGTVLTWMYVTDPICWWQVPERASEALSIQGMEAQYWASEIPEEADDTVITVNGQTISGSQTVEVGGVSITSGTVHGVEESGILTWEDPESNTQFFIKGAVSKEELLEMAQSITSTALQKD